MLLKILSVLIPCTASLLLVLNRKKKIISELGTVTWAYGLGICFSLVMNFVTHGTFRNAGVEILEIVAYLSVAIGIPLILFANSIKNMSSASRTAKKAFLLLIVSAALVTVLMYLLYTRNIENGKVLSGMALAIYTGGTPNLNAVAYIFHLDSSVILAANLSDVVIGGVFYLFIIVFSKFVAKRQPTESENLIADINCKIYSSKRQVSVNLLLAVLLALVSAGIGALIWILTGKEDGRLTDFVVPVMMIGTSIGGILVARNEKVSNVAENEGVGQFFVTVFSFAIASLVDINVMRNINSGIFVVFLSITVATFFIHMLLCKIFKVDMKTMIVTSTAGIYGPAFIPGVCNALGTRRLVTEGLIMGSLGYVIGTFLGCGLVLIL